MILKITDKKVKALTIKRTGLLESELCQEASIENDRCSLISKYRTASERFTLEGISSSSDSLDVITLIISGISSDLSLMVSVDLDKPSKSIPPSNRNYPNHSNLNNFTNNRITQNKNN